MGKILAVALHASDDPTKATLPFITAVGAIGADKPCTIALVGEAVSLVKEAVAKNIHGVGFPPLTELLAKIKDKIPVFVWGACSVARGVTEADLKALNASFMDPIKFANLIAESNVVSFWVGMACCSDCVGDAAAERQFGAAVAQRDLDRYRRKGPDASSRLLLDGVKSVAQPTDSVLDLGAGVGVLSFELLAHGLSRATLVDASPAYLSAARTEAERRGADSRVQCVTGDVVHLDGTVDGADVVVMHRVICCYPDWGALLGRATQLSGRVLAVSYPRDLWYVRGFMALENLRRRVFGNPFRTFVHSAVAMENDIVTAGFERISRQQTPIWCIDVYTRRHEA